IVLCHRDPLEVAFSCYRQWFNQNQQAFSYDLHDMAAFSRDFDRACAHWRGLHPDRVLDLVYEDLVRDQEGETRRLLAFCGLDFEAACLMFHANARRVTTISASQVREPIRRDTARADQYAALLDPLRSALGLPSYMPPSQG
ncbi:MAG: sulfotransferase, partial [Rudaea sp.]